MQNSNPIHQMDGIPFRTRLAIGIRTESQLAYAAFGVVNVIVHLAEISSLGSAFPQVLELQVIHLVGTALPEIQLDSFG
jgi:hypothetical protein